MYKYLLEILYTEQTTQPQDGDKIPLLLISDNSEWTLKRMPPVRTLEKHTHTDKEETHKKQG